MTRASPTNRSVRLLSCDHSLVQGRLQHDGRALRVKATGCVLQGHRQRRHRLVIRPSAQRPVLHHLSPLRTRALPANLVGPWSCGHEDTMQLQRRDTGEPMVATQRSGDGEGGGSGAVPVAAELQQSALSEHLAHLVVGVTGIEQVGAGANLQPILQCRCCQWIPHVPHAHRGKVTDPRLSTACGTH